jgi:hypothetical protein
MQLWLTGRIVTTLLTSFVGQSPKQRAVSRLNKQHERGSWLDLEALLYDCPGLLCILRLPEKCMRVLGGSIRLAASGDFER